MIKKSKPTLTIEEQHQIKKLKRNIFSNCFGLSLGLFATAVWSYSLSNDRGLITCVVVGTGFLMFSFYIAFFKWKQREILNFFADLDINYFVLFLGLVSLGAAIIQTPLAFLALSLFASAYIILIVGSTITFTRGIKLMKAGKQEEYPIKGGSTNGH